jgi:2-amino-4-hydroxy-6-hydroxymethyldihydropteridine diphosphokinase
MKIVIALGANLGDPSRQLSLAIDALRDFVDIKAISKFYQTEPFDVPNEQPKYLNAVVIGDTELKPGDLMNELLAIESSLGRERAFPKAARTIDLDIIDYGGYFLESDQLTLPHPRAHLRRFVLEPWLDIDPGALFPGKGPVAELLASLT